MIGCQDDAARRILFICGLFFLFSWSYKCYLHEEYGYVCNPWFIKTLLNKEGATYHCRMFHFLCEGCSKEKESGRAVVVCWVFPSSQAVLTTVTKWSEEQMRTHCLARCGMHISCSFAGHPPSTNCNPFSPHCVLCGDPLATLLQRSHSHI